MHLASLAALDLDFFLLMAVFLDKALQFQKGVINAPAAEMDVGSGHVGALHPSKMLLHLGFGEFRGQGRSSRMAEQVGMDMLLYPCLFRDLLQ